MSTLTNVPHSSVTSVHPEFRPLMEPGSRRPEFHRHRLELARSMRERGWLGRPLLGHARGDGTYQAWQGMHRLAAAGDVGLAEIPMLIVTVGDLMSVGFTDSEIAHDPWQYRDRLRGLPDAAAYELALLEDREQLKRGF